MSLRYVLLLCIALAGLPSQADGLFASLSARYQSTKQALSGHPQDCVECRDGNQDITALRTTLPADWQLEIKREPVFDSNILVVQAGQQNKQTLLLVHGLGQNGFRDWQGIMPELAKQYHVLSLDLPGFGYSAKPRGKYSPTNYAKVVAWLVSQYAHGKPVVVGHSMGGAVALRYAATYPDQLSKLILVDAAGILERTAFLKHTATLPLPTDRGPGIFKRASANIRDLGDTVVEKISSLPDPTNLIRNNNSAWGALLSNQTNTNAALALVEEDFSAAVHTLPVPTQIIWGEVDPVAPLRTAKVLAGSLPHASLHTLPKVGHVPMAAATEAFMAKLHLALEEETPVATNLTVTPADATTPDLHCRGESGWQYQGRYREVLIEGCTGIKMQDLSAEKVTLRDASVEMQNVTVRGDGTAVEVNHSVLLVTHASFSGATAIAADDSRLDLAGVHLTGGQHAIEVKGSSRFIVSVSEVVSPIYQGYLHGSFSGKAQALDRW